METGATGELSVDAIYGEAKRIIVSARVETAIYFFGVSALSIFIDLSEWSGGGDILFALASLALGYVLTLGMVAKGRLSGDGPRRGFGTYFVVSLLSTLGMMFGALLFIIPGVILLVRWMPACGFALADGLGASNALGRSWDATRETFWPLLLALLIPLALYGSGAVAYILAYPDDSITPSVLAIVVANITLGLAGVAVTAMGLASYSLLRNDTASVTDVFA